MSKIDLVRQEMMKALKEKDMERKNALSILLSALKAKFIDKRAELTEDEENAIVFREIKQAQETLASAAQGRADLAEECNLRIKIYSEFVPKMMNETEISTIIQKVLGELKIDHPEAKDKGKIMKTLMPLVKGKADGALVNRLVGKLFQ
ncbi:MAG TPA: GatB/YqeY domain-containing protein [Clostridia bacterium]|nr:GatB/YqeY domain-containing protein [Clostridia bacterium]